MLWTTLVLFSLASMMLVTLIATNSVTEAFSNFPWIFWSAIFFTPCSRFKRAIPTAPFGPVGPVVQAFPINHGPVGGDLLEAAAQVIKVWTWEDYGRSPIKKPWAFQDFPIRFPEEMKDEIWLKYDDIFSWNMYFFRFSLKAIMGLPRKLHVGLDLWVPSLYQPSPLDAVVFQLSRPTSWNKIQKAWTSTCRSLRGRQPLGSAAG